MDRKYLAFDIETAKILPDGEQDLKSHRPLGITCAATLAQGKGEVPIIWYSRADDDYPAGQLNVFDVRDLVGYLIRMSESGYTILTWNGLNFDFDILAEESGMVEECKILAWNHVDMMFDFFCRRGFMVGLNSVAEGMGLSGKAEGMDGSMAPRLWAEKKYGQVMEYVKQDAITTLEVALAAEKAGEVKWITRKGTPSEQTIAGGWLQVPQANVLPLPDVSWIDAPLERPHFTQWIGDLGS